ncbi:hypothetical protein HDE77_003519 [Rhodanobacter sp. MP7CTX1]|nr:hypothetical protein [Rhodanobacter sp. MP7CTX1]
MFVSEHLEKMPSTGGPQVKRRTYFGYQGEDDLRDHDILSCCFGYLSTNLTI